MPARTRQPDLVRAFGPSANGIIKHPTKPGCGWWLTRPALTPLNRGQGRHVLIPVARPSIRAVCRSPPRFCRSATPGPVAAAAARAMARSFAVQRQPLNPGGNDPSAMPPARLLQGPGARRPLAKGPDRTASHRQPQPLAQGHRPRPRRRSCAHQHLVDRLGLLPAAPPGRGG